MVAVGCAAPDAPPDPDQVRRSEVRRELREAGETAGAYLRQEQRDFLEATEAQLQTLEVQINTLEMRIEAAGAAAATQMEGAIERLRVETAELRQELQKVSADSARAWEDVQAGLSEAVEELERAYDEAIARFES